MTSRDFCYWLQGFFELAEGQSGMSHDQAEMVRKHLSLVFKHEIDPSHGTPEHVAELQELHDKIEKVEKTAVGAARAARDPFGPKIMC